MAFASEPHSDTQRPGDALDEALAISWALSELAVDVFGMLFWAALGLAVVFAAR